MSGVGPVANRKSASSVATSDVSLEVAPFRFRGGHAGSPPPPTNGPSFSTVDIGSPVGQGSAYTASVQEEHIEIDNASHERAESSAANSSMAFGGSSAEEIVDEDGTRRRISQWADDDNSSTVSGATKILQRAYSGKRIRAWFAKLPLMTKMLFIVSIPIIAVLISSGIHISDDSSSLKDMEDAKQFAALADVSKISTFKIAEERDMVIKYRLGMNVTLDDVNAAFAALDAQLLEYELFYNDSFSIAEVKASGEFGHVMEHASERTTFRAAAVGGSASFTEIMEWYDELADEMTHLLQMSNTVLKSVETQTGIDKARSEMATTESIKRTGDWALLALQQVATNTTLNSTTDKAFPSQRELVHFIQQFETATENKAEWDRMQTNVWVHFLYTSLDKANATAEAAWEDVLSNCEKLTGLISGYPSEDDFFNTLDQVADYFSRRTTATIAAVQSKADSLTSEATASLITTIAVSGGVITLTLFLLWVMITSVNMANGMLRNEVRRRRVTEKAIWRFFPFDYANLLEAEDVTEIQAGDRKSLRMTIMFADIRNFTTVSEALGADRTYEWLMSYIKIMSKIIAEHDGFIKSTMGDGITAVFRTAEGAVQAAVQMQEKTAELNEYQSARDKDWHDYAIGVGIHTGPVVVGVIGDDERMEGTIVSSVVSTAMQLETLCKSYGSKILISEETRGEANIDVHEYAHRLVGVHNENEWDQIRLYDVYHTDGAQAVTSKRSYKDFMQSLVEDFESEEYGECRERLDAFKKQYPLINDIALSFYDEEIDRLVKEKKGTDPEFCI